MSCSCRLTKDCAKVLTCVPDIPRFEQNADVFVVVGKEHLSKQNKMSEQANEAERNYNANLHHARSFFFFARIWTWTGFHRHGHAANAGWLEAALGRIRARVTNLPVLAVYAL